MLAKKDICRYNLNQCVICNSKFTSGFSFDENEEDSIEMRKV